MKQETIVCEICKCETPKEFESYIKNVCENCICADDCETLILRHETTYP